MSAEESAGDRPRGSVVVCVLAGDGDGLPASLASVLRHTPEEVEVRLAGPESIDLEHLRSELGAGLVRPLGRATSTERAVLAAAVAPADVVFIFAPCRVAAGWLDGLRAAADALEVAAVAPLALAELPGLGADFETAAARLREAAPQRPRSDAPWAVTRYVRRSAIDLAGDPGPGFHERCRAAGLALVIADDVLVDEGTARPPATSDETQARARAAAVRIVSGLSVLVDARNLDGPLDGTRVHVLELLAALGRGGGRVRALVPARLDAETRAALAGCPGVETVASADGVRADVVHRPFQVAAHADLAVLGRLAPRLVITQQDLISFHNPAYFASRDGWRGYREMTAHALRIADRVLFFSAHVRDEALGEGLVEAHRAAVVPIGVDHRVVAAPAVEADPGTVRAELAERELILCLGTDLRHKNRVFALRLASVLRTAHGWEGRLVLAGPHVHHGSSRAQEQALLAADRDLAGVVVDLGQISETEKHQLLRRAGLVLYPTVHEGFGLIPFEAAAHGTPCLWAPGTALRELLGDATGEIVPWDAVATAPHALALLRDPKRREANLAAINAAAQRLRWDATAAALRAEYATACATPPAPAGRVEREGGLMNGGLSDDAVRLVGPGGAIPPELERPLLALATHRRLAAPVFGALRAAYRLSRRERR